MPDSPALTAIVERHVVIATGSVGPAGALIFPPDAQGLVAVAHRRGSGRFSPPSRAVARELVRAGLATLLMDLLTADEDDVDRGTGHLRFDVQVIRRLRVPVA